MTDHSSYLLRTWPQIRDFRCRYAGYIARQADAYVSWISRMPLREWMDYLQGVPVIRRNWNDAEFESFWHSAKPLKQKRK